jgi:carbonic anhydrase
VEPVTAIQALLDGYTRFATGRPEHPNQTHAWLAEVAAAPQPIAVVLGCMDARVPPEVIFDQGIGDLLVVRVAGALITDAVLGSIELAVQDAGVPLVVVLGHARCKAIQMALEVLSGTREAVGHTAAIVEVLLPAIAAIGEQPGDRLRAAAGAQVTLAAQQLRDAEPALADRVRGGALEVRGWLYDVDTGILEMLT